MGNWTSDKETTYFNHRLVSDAKHFAASGEGDQRKPAATFVTIVDGTKNGEDIFVDVKVTRGAERHAGLKKGSEVTVRGTVEFSIDRNGKLRGKIWDGRISYGSAVRDALKATNQAAADKAAADAAEDAAREAATEAPADDNDAPAFE